MTHRSTRVWSGGLYRVWRNTYKGGKLLDYFRLTGITISTIRINVNLAAKQFRLTQHNDLCSFSNRFNHLYVIEVSNIKMSLKFTPETSATTFRRKKRVWVELFFFRKYWRMPSEELFIKKTSLSDTLKTLVDLLKLKFNRKMAAHPGSAGCVESSSRLPLFDLTSLKCNAF